MEDEEHNTKIRRNKKILFSNERTQIINKLNTLIGLNDKNNSILLVELYKNQELIKYLNEIKDDIKKYYRCCRWGYFVWENNGKKGDEITLLRAIYKDHDYNILSKNILIEYDGVKNRYVKLFFLSNQNND